MDSKSVAKERIFPPFIPEVSHSGRSQHRSIEGPIPVEGRQKSASDLVSIINRRQRRGSEEFSRAEVPEPREMTVVPN